MKNSREEGTMCRVPRGSGDRALRVESLEFRVGVDGTQVTMQAVDLANVKTIVIHQIRPARTLYFSQAAAE